MKKLLWVFGLCLMFLGAGYFFFYSGYFQIKHIDITKTWIEKKEIIELMGERINKHILLLPAQQIEQVLENDPRIQSARVKRVWPDRVNVQIDPYEPFVTMKLTTGTLLIDKEGRAIAYNVGQQTKFHFEGFHVKRVVLGDILELKEHLVFLRTLDLVTLFEQYGLFPKRFVWTKTGMKAIVSEDYVVSFGECSDIERKFNIFVAIFENHKAEGVQEGFLDISDTDAVRFQPFPDEEP